MKSRTVVSHTFSKVKARISSIGSLVSTTRESPNPLLAPPLALDSPRTPVVTQPPTPVANQPQATSLDGTASPPSSTAPPIAALSIETSSWTVFNTHPMYHTTAYVKFDISCIPQSSGIPSLLPLPPNTSAGHLHSLTLSLSLTGPAVTLSHYGNLTYPTLNPTDHWINLIHIGIKDTSLASKLSTSLRSLGRSARNSASRSAGRLGRYTNIDLINRWLNILESDDVDNSNSTSYHEPVVLHATVRYKHLLLPESTMLKDKASCRLKMTKEEIERAEISGVDLSKKRAGSDEDGDDGDDEDEYEERLREARVLGAPWL